MATKQSISVKAQPAAPALPKAPFVDGRVRLEPDILVATVDIPAGAVVVREFPFAAVDFKFAAHSNFVDAVAALQPHLLPGLPPSIKDVIYKNKEQSVQALAGYCVAFGGEEGSPDMVMTVLPKIASLSDSNQPNCTLSVAWGFRINERIIVSVVTLRPITAGESLKISHGSVLIDPVAREARRSWRALARVPAQQSDSAPTQPTGGTAPWVQGVIAVKAEGALSPELVADFAHVIPSARVTKSSATEAHQASAAFLGRAEQALADTHWMMIAARRTAIVSLMYLAKWSAAWGILQTQSRAVFKLLPPAHAEAQYHTHALAEHILRAWNVEDPSAAGAASIGAMMRYTMAAHHVRGTFYKSATNGGDGGESHDAGEEGVQDSSATPASAKAKEEEDEKVTEMLRGHEEAWVRDMLHGAQILRPAQQQAFIDGPPLPGAPPPAR